MNDIEIIFAVLMVAAVLCVLLSEKARKRGLRVEWQHRSWFKDPVFESHALNMLIGSLEIATYMSSVALLVYSWTSSSAPSAVMLWMLFAAMVAFACAVAAGYAFADLAQSKADGTRVH